MGHMVPLTNNRLIVKPLRRFYKVLEDRLTEKEYCSSKGTYFLLEWKSVIESLIRLNNLRSEGQLSTRRL